MPISFQLTESTIHAREHYHRMALAQMRPISSKYDELEHETPSEWIEYFWKHARRGPGKDTSWRGPNDGFVRVCVQAEELCWGDAALYLRMPTPALGGSAASAGPSHIRPVRESSPTWRNTLSASSSVARAAADVS